MPEPATLSQLRELLDQALYLVEIGGGSDEDRAAFRRRKDDLLARLLPTGDES